MRPADEHLTPQELDLLLLNPADSRDSNASGALSPGVRKHLNGCNFCQSIAETYRKTEEVLQSLRAGSQASDSETLVPGPECPSEDTWSTLAVGLMEDEKASSSVTHAATCNLCGPRLKQAMQDLSPDITPEEEEALARIPMSPGLEREIASRLAAQSQAENAWVSKSAPVSANSSPLTQQPDKILPLRPQPVHQPSVVIRYGFQRWPNAIWAAAVIVITAASWFVWLKTKQPDVNKLLAQAYTKQRTIDLRISGAEYARIREQRAGAGTNTTRSAELYKALGLLAENRRPHDAAWLGGEGRAELLQGEYAASVATLEEAHRLSPQADDIEIDLASALFQRSTQPGFEEDLPRSVDLLHDMISRNPQNSIAWFNLAIANEKLHLLAEASQAWVEYLKIDPSSEWSQEAKARKEKLEKEIEDYKKRSGLPLDGPETLVNLIQAPLELQILDQRIESYMAVVLTTWLPEIAAGWREPSTKTSLQAATRIIAQLALQNHQDTWLHDLLAEADGSQADNSGIIALGKSKKSSELGHFQEANTFAKNAARLFATQNQIAGLLGAKAEEVYSTHLLQQGEACYQSASNLLSRLHGKAFAWLEIQTLLEASICANMTGRLGDARLYANHALALAEAHKYGNLYLRAIALVASLEWTTGSFNNAIRLAGDGLDVFWKGSYPPIRGYGLYSVLDSIAEDSQEWFSQASVGREAVGLIADSPYHAMLGVECERIGNAALRSSQSSMAEEFFQKSLHHFSLAPEDANAKILSVAADVGMARVDLQRGQFESARQWLEKSQKWAGETDNRFVQIEYYEAQAEVLQAAGSSDIAKESSLHAVAIAEKSLRPLAGERERLIWMREYERLYRSLMSLELAEDPNYAFSWWEWYRATPLRVSRKGDSAVFDSTQVFRTVSQQRNLVLKRQAPENAVIISYILLAHEAGVWVLHGSDTRYYKLSASAPEIELLAHNLIRDCADENSHPDEILVLQRRLYDLLVRPFAAQFEGDEKILIEPDGDLDGLPFETLVNEDGQSMGQTHKISFSPGIAYLAATRSSLQPGPATTALIVENSLSRAPGIKELPSLESAADEARNIHHLIPDSRILSGPEMSLAAIMQAARHADIFHFAGHALPEKDGAGLLLAGVDASGRPEVINGAALEKFGVEKVRLVVLSACETAGDSSRTLSASGSLARVFLASGVPQVVASRWPVDSHATSMLMENFYRHLLSGSPAVDALREAQQEIRSQPGYSHPYYWASFSVFGNP